MVTNNTHYQHYPMYVHGLTSQIMKVSIQNNNVSVEIIISVHAYNLQ